MENFPKISRRLFLQTATYSAAALALLKSVGQQAWAAATASDAKVLAKPAAANQGYRRITSAKNPGTEIKDKNDAVYKAWERHTTSLTKELAAQKIDNKAGKIIPQCANCMQYKTPNGEYGACAMVGAMMKAPDLIAVHQTGWCKVYAVNKSKTAIEASAKLN
jgi:hypothetical protein